jgi:hypothetical protein
MPGTRKLQYNSYYVRPEFRRIVCRELDLPSGRPSGYELYPVEDEYVQKVAEMYEVPDVKVMTACGADNIHEWLLWTAARVRYGVNYLSPKRNQFWLTDDMYEPIRKQENEFEEELIKLENLIVQRAEWAAEILTEREKEEKVKKIKNILRECLTSPDNDVIM